MGQLQIYQLAKFILNRWFKLWDWAYGKSPSKESDRLFLVDASPDFQTLNIW